MFPIYRIKGFTDYETFVLLVATTISSGLSILGATFIISSTIRLKKTKILFWRLITFLSIADFISGMAEFIVAVKALNNKPLSGFECIAQGAAVEASYEASNLYILTIAFAVYSIIVNKQTQWSIKKEISIHLGVWGFSLFLGFLPILMSLSPDKSKLISYGPAGSWCWIQETPSYGRFVMSYIHVWIIIAIILVVYVRVWRYMKDPPLVVMMSPEKHRTWKKLFLQLFMFPLVYVLLWIPPSLNRILEAFHDPVFALVLIESLCIPIQGLCNAALYGFFSNVLQKEGQTKKYSVLLNTTPSVREATLLLPSKNINEV